ncbi:MAG: porin [Phycisphaerales bacterium]
MTTTLMVSAGAILALAARALAVSADAGAASPGADGAARTALAAPPDQKFTVDVHGYMHFRFNWNHRDGDSTPGAGDETTTGFQAAATKLTVAGMIGSEALTYGVMLRFTEGAGLVDDAWGQYAFEGGTAVRWGQFKLPILRDETMSDTAQLAAARSVTNSVFSQGRSQAVQVSREMERFRVAGAFSDGTRTASSDYTAASEADFALTGRADFKWAGDWKQGRDFTSFQGQPYFGLVGGAAHYQSGGETGGTVDQDIFLGTVDASVEGNGWNAYAAFIYRTIDPATGSDFTDMGFIIQGGIFVAPTWELFGRFDTVMPDDDRTTDESFSTITVGATHYFIPDSHAAKFTVDLQVFLDEQAASIAPANTLTGLLPSSEDGQFHLRAQMQLLF